MEIILYQILFLVYIFAFQWLILCGSFTSGDTQMNLVPKFPILAEGRRFAITCQSASDVGDVLELVLERSSVSGDNFDKLLTADEQDLRWNLSKSKDIRARCELQGNVSNTETWFEFTLLKLKCSDSAKYRCITNGRLASSTSKILEVQVVGSPQDVFISKTVSLGTLQPVKSLIYKKGDVLKLTCSAKLGHPLTLSTFHWYKIITNYTKVEIASSAAAKFGHGPTSGACLFSRGFSNITYRPDVAEVEAVILCEVQFQNPTFPNQKTVINTSVLLNAYVEPSKPKIEGHSTAVLIAAIIGSVTAVTTFGIVILVTMRVCGYRFTVKTEDDEESKSSSWSPPPVPLKPCGVDKARVGLPDQLSIYETIDQPDYVKSDSCLDNHGYLDLNQHHAF